MNSIQERLVEIGRELHDEHGRATVEWAAMNLIEDGSIAPIIVGYGSDRDMYEAYGPEGDLSEAEWWADFPPIEGTRFRVFYPEDIDGIPHLVRLTMAAIGAVPVGVFKDDEKGSYEHRGRNAAHYLLDDHAPIRLMFENEISED